MPGILSCADPLNQRRTDPHFAAETAAARELGATVGLIDHDLLLAGDAAAAVRNVPATSGPPGIALDGPLDLVAVRTAPVGRPCGRPRPANHRGQVGRRRPISGVV